MIPIVHTLLHFKAVTEDATIKAGNKAEVNGTETCQALLIKKRQDFSNFAV